MKRHTTGPLSNLNFATYDADGLKDFAELDTHLHDLCDICCKHLHRNMVGQGLVDRLQNGLAACKQHHRLVEEAAACLARPSPCVADLSFTDRPQGPAAARKSRLGLESKAAAQEIFKLA